MDVTSYPQHQSPFFRLPIEIRCSIYDLVLGAEILAPDSLKSAKRIARCKQQVKAPGPRLIYPRFYQTPASSLLLTCHTTLAEVGALPQQMHKRHRIPTCKLDLIINRKYAIPTWIRAPYQSKETEYDLEISLRVLCTGTLRAREAWIGGTTSASFMTILNSLVHHGPQFVPSTRRSAPEPLRLNAITMDVSCPSNLGVGPGKLYHVPPLRGSVPDCALSGLFEGMCDLERNGLIWGKLKKMRIYSMQLGQGISVEVTNQGTSERELDYWASKGYTWGLNI